MSEGTHKPTFRWPAELLEELKIDGHVWEDETPVYLARLERVNPATGYRAWAYIVNTEIRPEITVTCRAKWSTETEIWRFPPNTPHADIMRFIYCHHALGD